MMRAGWSWIGVVAWWFVAACASAPHKPTTVSQTHVDMEPLRITAHSDANGALSLEAYDARDLYERGTELFQAKLCDEAVPHYDRLVAEFAESKLVGPALFNAGLCMQAVGRFDQAAERYRRLREMRRESEDFLYTSLRLAEVLVQLEAFAELETLAAELLAREDLSPYDRLEAMARRSQAFLGQGRLDEAQEHAEQALYFFRSRPQDEAIHDEFYAAANSFVIAEVYRLRAQGVEFPDDLDGQKAALEQRAQLILDAQRRYSDTISFVNVDNYHWMTASGYRLGEMYDRMWGAIMTAPAPPHMRGEEALNAYRWELAKLIKPLMRHAIRYWEMTLLLIERTGIRNQWTDKIREDLERVRARMLEQPPGPGGIPASPPAPEPARSPEPVPSGDQDHGVAPWTRRSRGAPGSLARRPRGGSAGFGSRAWSSMLPDSLLRHSIRPAAHAAEWSEGV